MVRDALCSLALIAVAAGYFALANGIGRSALADEVGPAGLPLAYATLLGVLGLLLALKTLLRYAISRRHAPVAEAAAEPRTGRVLARAAGTLGIGAGFVALVNVLGYWLSLLLLLPAMAAYQGQALNRRLALVAVVGATAFWVLFAWLLGIPMPAPFWLGTP